MDMNIDDEGFSSEQCPKLDLHLNSPITRGLITLFVDAINLHPSVKYNASVSTTEIAYVELPPVVTRTAQQLISLIGNKSRVQQLMSLDSYEVVQDVFSYTYNPVPGARVWLPAKAAAITKVLEGIIRTYDVRLMSEFSTDVSLQFTDQEIAVYAIKMALEDIRDAVVRKAEGRDESWASYPFPSKRFPGIIVSRSVCMFVETPGRCEYSNNLTHMEMQKIIQNNPSLFIATYEQLLCLLDTMTARLYTMYSQRILSDDLPFKVPNDKLIAIYQTFDRELAIQGNNIYNQIKIFESLVYSIIIEKTDVTSMRSDFRTYLRDSSASDGYQLVLEMDKLLDDFTVPQLAEVFGMYRHWGHPIVDEAAGCQKVKDIVQTREPVDDSIMTEIVGHLVKQFTYEFIAQHNRWPACDTKDLDPGSALHRLASTNDRNISDYDNKITIQEWANLKIKSELEFDYHIDYTDLLNDKAISPLATENGRTYNNKMSGVNSKPLSTSRRVLSEIMMRRHLDLREICDMIEKRAIPREWWIIKLSPKEREVNIKPRLFAMMVLEMRLYFCLIESNISKKVFGYFPQQSMTLNEEKLTRRLISMSTPKGTQNYLEITLGIDFKSWNIHWSWYNTHRIAELLEDWFGRPGLFTFGHQFFSMCEVSLSSKFLIPEQYIIPILPHLKLDDNKYCWRNHMGGLEGILQKLWTLITIGILLVVESRTGIKSTIIGQGDNQVCKLRIPVGDSDEPDYNERLKQNETAIRSSKEEFLRVLNHVSAAIGIELKPLESWASDSTMIYSKEIYVNGANMSQMIKRIGRTMADVNDDYPTCSVRIGTIQTAGFSAAQKTYVMAVPWLVAQVESCLTLLRDAEICGKLCTADRAAMRQALNCMETSPVLLFFLLSHGDFTGFPVMNLLEYEYRGHPDPFCTYVTFLYRLWRSNTGVQAVRDTAGKILEWFRSRQYPVGVASSELLVSNPAAINIWTPTPLSRLFKNEIFNFIASTALNTDIKDLINATSLEFDKRFYDYLIKSEPLYPRLLNVISTHSPTGTRLYMVSKFTNTKTLQGMSYGGAKFGSSSMILQSDKEFYLHLLKTYLAIHKCPVATVGDVTCPTLLVEDVRGHSYSPLIGARKICGVTMPHPAHILDIKYEDTSQGSEYVSILAPTRYKLDKMLSAGSQPAFVGTRTIEKTSGRIVTISGKSRPFDDACRLKQMQDWATRVGGDLHSYLSELISCRTNVPHDIIGGMAGISYIGSHIHRVGDPSTKKETKNTIRHSVTTWFAMSSDKLGLTTRGGDDYNIQISGLMHYMIHDIVKTCIADPEIEVCYVRGYQVNHCCHQAYDNIPADCEGAGPAVKINTANPLLYADIQVFQKMVTPTSSIIGYETWISSEDAIGYYMMSRFKGITSHAILTVQSIKGPYLTRISMSEVLNIGLVPIIKSFAKYLYLYIGDSYARTRVYLPNMQADLWCGLSDLCLVSSVMGQLITALNLDGTDNCYKHSNKVTKLLNELLVIEMDSIHNHPNKIAIYKGVKFFLLNNVKFASVFLMWWFHVKCVTLLDDKDYERIRRNVITASRASPDWNSTVRNIIENITNSDYRNVLWSQISGSLKMRIMKNPPEFYFRHPDSLPATPPAPPIAQIHNIEQRDIDTIYSTEYPVPPLVFNQAEDTQYLRIQLAEMAVARPADVQRRYTRCDQAARLVGTLSTAYLKYMQVIIKEEIQFTNTSICTADGEAGVARAIATYSNYPVHYNSLQSRDIITQRYENFVPGSFLLYRDLIQSQQLSLIYGGDLTDHTYVEKFIKVLPLGPSLLTCDAEGSGLYNPTLQIKIITSLLKIVHRTGPQACIWKLFLDNPMMIAATISNLRLYYVEVKIVTASYSSHENKECFLVAKGLKVVTTPVPEVMSESLYVEGNFRKYLQPIQDYHTLRVSRNIPFICNQYQLMISLLNLGLQLGYHDNLRHTLYHLTGMYAPEDINHESMAAWLKTCIITKLNNISAVCSTHSTLASDRERKLSVVDSMRLSLSASISVTLERDTNAILCCQIVLKMIEVSDIVSAHHAYCEALDQVPNMLIDKNGIAYYDFTIRNIINWETRYLKHIWRAWGHRHII